jgi:hypothetical protein
MLPQQVLQPVDLHAVAIDLDADGATSIEPKMSGPGIGQVFGHTTSPGRSRSWATT